MTQHGYGEAVPTFIGSDGMELHYDEFHRGDAGQTGAVIVLGGGAGRHPSYLGDLAGLAERVHLVVPHLRGVGRSPFPATTEMASFWRQAEDVECLRQQLNLEQAHLLGHSAGARLAISYAVQFADVLGRMVLVTPPTSGFVEVKSDADVLIERRRGEPAVDAAIAAWDVGPDGEDDGAFNAWQAKIAPLSYAVWGPAAQNHAVIGAYSFRANRAYFSVPPPEDLAARFGESVAKTLVIAGADDCITGVAPVVALSELVSRGSIAMIDHCGHYPWIEQPAAFRAVLDPFLCRLA